MTRLARYLRSLLWRKPTTPVHIVCGVVVALFLISDRWLLGLVLFSGFAWFEYWECQRTGDSGHLDYWELLAGMFVAAVGILWQGNMIR